MGTRTVGFFLFLLEAIQLSYLILIITLHVQHIGFIIVIFAKVSIYQNLVLKSV